MNETPRFIGAIAAVLFADSSTMKVVQLHCSEFDFQSHNGAIAAR